MLLIRRGHRKVIAGLQVLVDLRAISWFMACFLIGSLISLWPIGYLSDRIGRRGIMAALSIISIVCCLFAIATPKDGITFYLVIVADDRWHRQRRLNTWASLPRQVQRSPGKK